MKRPFKQLALTLLIATALPAAAQLQEPAISMHILSDESISDTWTISLGAIESTYIEFDCGFGPTEYLIRQTTPDPESGANVSTITFQPSLEGEVKIYGDPLKINYLDVKESCVDRLDISRCSNIEILNIERNFIQELDLSHLKKLSGLFASDNPFDKAPFLLGPDHPELVILEMQQIGSLDRSLNISDYPKLKVFYAYSTKDLHFCDPTGCPELMVLSLDCTNVASVDVSKNPELVVLNVAQTRISDIDISANAKLRQFFCSHAGTMNTECKFKSLDLSNNPELKALFCSGNLITGLDLSGNPNLIDLYASNNYMTSLDLSGNPELINVWIDKNCMDFVTLPAPSPAFYDYLYEQRPIAFDRCYPEGCEIDLGSKLLRQNSTTTARLFSANEELGEEFYSYTDGVVTLKKEVSDSIHFEFYNTLFPEYPLKTTNFRVKTPEEFAKDSPVISFRLKPTAGEDIALKVGIIGASPENPKRFAVDFGDGEPVDFLATSESLPETPNALGKKKKIGAMQVLMPENTDIYSFSVRDTPISTIDVTAASSIHELEVAGCGIPSINLDYNRWLEYLDVSGNLLKTLKLDPDDFIYVKHDLRTIYANNNHIETLENKWVRNPYIFEIANNKLTSINLEGSVAIERLDLSNNLLTLVDLYDCIALKYLDLSGNRLTEQIVPDQVQLDYLDISGNHIPLSNLQLPEYFKGEYIYAPQQVWTIPVKGPSVGLSEQWLDIDGQTTEFHWYKADNSELTADEYSVSRGYVFRFPDVSVGEIYCTWTHPLFPDFKGDDIYRSSVMRVAEMPKYVQGTFTTLEDTEGSLVITSTEPDAYLYIDWAGDGNPEQYRMNNEMFTIYDVPSYANANVTVLTYEDENFLGVFSYSGSTMSKADFSGMTNLYALTLENTALNAKDLVLPPSDAMREFNLVGNNLDGVDFSRYENLVSLNLCNCGYTSIDVSMLKNLQRLVIQGNRLTSVKLDNPLMWELNLMGNSLESIDLTGVPAVEQLYLTDNLLTDLDVTGLSRLHILWLNHNYFKLTTLPRVMSSYFDYFYYDQYPWQVVPVGNVVDLSEQLMIGSNKTGYRWFRGDMYYNEYGEIVGDELVEGFDYTENEGVFTFLKGQNSVRCLLSNLAFPDIVYVTAQLNIEVAGTEALSAEAISVASGRGFISVKGANGPTALYRADGTAAGISDSSDATFSALAEGIYLVALPDGTTRKVLVK